MTLMVFVTNLVVIPDPHTKQREAVDSQMASPSQSTNDPYVTQSGRVTQTRKRTGSPNPTATRSSARLRVRQGQIDLLVHRDRRQQAEFTRDFGGGDVIQSKKSRDRSYVQ